MRRRIAAALLAALLLTGCPFPAGKMGLPDL